jgi:hypothetical protein
MSYCVLPAILVLQAKMVILMIVRDLGLTFLCEDAHGLLNGKSIFDTELSAAASLQRVQMGTAAQSLSKVTCKCPDIGSFAAGHSDFSPWQA